MATTGRPVPPGCCPGCLLSYEVEPCALHSAAADLEGAYRTAADRGVAVAVVSPQGA